MLSLDLSLEAFVRRVEDAVGAVIHGVHPDLVKGDGLAPPLRKTIEGILGKYLWYSPSCNRDDYLCVVGECTECDPWAGS